VIRRAKLVSTTNRCGTPPADFEDEEAIVEDRQREAVLKLVR